MSGFIEAIFAAQNIGFTVLVGFVLFYWMLVIVVGAGMEILDGALNFFDSTFSGGEIDPSTGLDHGVDGGAGPGNFVGTTLRFFNFGEVPATIILSVIIVLSWASNVILYSWSKSQPDWVQVLVLVGSVVGATFLSKPITSPMKEIFSAKEGKGVERTNLIGCECILTMAASQAQLTTAEAKTASNRFINISVRCAPGQGPIPKGGRAVIVSVDPTAGGYLIRLPGTQAPSSEGGTQK